MLNAVPNKVVPIETPIALKIVLVEKINLYASILQSVGINTNVLAAISALVVNEPATTCIKGMIVIRPIIVNKI
ncbi:hypothetical protein D3C73_820070 [compost metagenome]